MSRMSFMNTEIDNLTMDEALAKIDELIQLNKNAYVVTPNVDHLIRLEKGGKFAEAYRNADLVLTDGKPLIWISKWYGRPIKEKISGSDLFPRICELAAEKTYRMFLLGAAEGIAQKAADKLIQKYPGLQIVGCYSPPYGFEKDEEEKKKISRIIQEAAPHILILALGTPKQELYIAENREELHVPVSFGFGATLDFEAGNVKRAPQWMSDHGLEWLFRITQDPKRLAKRYLVEDTKILRLIWKYRNRGK